MHAMGVVFSKSGQDLNDIMEPFRERVDDDGNVVGCWDYWNEGGRYSETGWIFLNEGGSPYFFITLDGKWMPSEEYSSEDGFRDVEGFDESYSRYVQTVPSDTIMTVVDIHF